MDWLLLRKAAKKHGTAQLLESPHPVSDRPKVDVILVEDVVTTGQ